MKTVVHCTKAALLGAAIVILAGTSAFSQSPDSTTTAAPTVPAPAAGAPAPIIHYHNHYHFHNYGNVPPSALMYPNYASPSTTGALNSSYPLPPNMASPTPAHPYPPGYIPGQFAPLASQNSAPGAPTAQGVIHVFLPTSDATVYLNGQKMRGNGKDRKLTTPTLAPNNEYQYFVTATFKQNGESMTEYRKVDVGAGEYTVADFNRPAEENPIKLPAGPVDPNTVAPDDND